MSEDTVVGEEEVVELEGAEVGGEEGKFNAVLVGVC